MKSTVLVTPCNKEIPFPKLMQREYDGIIVLFLQKGVGTVIANLNTNLGYQGKVWIMSDFKDFTGSVCLENGEA